MFEEEIQETLTSQKKFFAAGHTMDINFRLDSLKKLKSAVIASEQEIVNALHADLKKPAMEAYLTELAIIMDEINFAIKNLRKWVKPVKAKSSLLVFPSRNYITPEPFGMSLIISPWNYPVQLALTPLVGAISAGNCCIIKPSEYSPTTGSVIKKLIESTFDRSYIAVIEGDEYVSRYLLEQNFDKIFFTGSPRVGRIVMEKAARNLASVTLELGGKSPCIVDKGVNIDVTAKRILWGKFSNAGQTCIAPDYLIVDREIKERLYAAFAKWLKVFFTENPEDSLDMGRIINQTHFQRLNSYLEQGRIIIGGNFSEDDLYIEPTIMEVSDMNLPVMKEEIFGPILPVVEYSHPEDIESIIALNPNPLGFYLFSNNKVMIERLIKRIPFGGGCVNDTLIHSSNHHLPFGGRGNSGMGSYHGINSFEAFSYRKPVLKKGFAFDLAMKYPPYQDAHKYIRKFILK